MNYEKLGAFYLGRVADLETGNISKAPLLYDAKDLTTHAICVGMTGSGKTGLGVTLLEEAAIDGVPAIAIDPKGDLGNLLLTFPKLRPADFRPWIDESEAARNGRTADEEARAVAERWRHGLAEWGQAPARIGRFGKAVDRTIYTPGSTAGAPLSVLRSFAAPSAEVAADDEARNERVLALVSALLTLVGIDADPVRSREHILLSTLVDHAWREGRDLDLASLIQQVQKPPIERIGVMDLASVFPPGDRFELAMTLNNVLASPAFAAWGEGAALDVGRLLYTADGRPRLSIISIAHLSDSQRMFVVTTLLNEIVSWMRRQSGSRTLRALLYMDEVFGYFPPTANPPSKIPMLTLLKQARAYGLGVVLATQNPVDLDYKGLSNAGTWFLGRLQTERDKMRVIEGLEGASAMAAASFDRARMERILAGLGSRVFLMNNVHEDEPVLFHTRWALSYLGGPLTRDQIRLLTGSARPEPTPPATPTPSAVQNKDAGDSRPVEVESERQRPVLPAGIVERFLPTTHMPGAAERLVYRPALLATATLHYASTRANVDEWEDVVLLAPLSERTVDAPWRDASVIGRAAPDTVTEPEDGIAFGPLPSGAAEPKRYTRWKKMLATHLYQTRPLRLWRCREPKLISKPAESEGEFRGRLGDALREDRDLAVEKLRRRFAPKLSRLQDRIRTAEQRIDVEESQYRQQKMQTAISIGATLVGALFGRKLASSRTVGKATTAMRGAGRAARERGDIGRAHEKVQDLRKRLAEVEDEFERELGKLDTPRPVADLDIDDMLIRPRKGDLDIGVTQLAWAPWRVDAQGVAEPAFEKRGA